jgi:tetratricopeptide (TPR) repeat protein
MHRSNLPSLSDGRPAARRSPKGILGALGLLALVALGTPAHADDDESGRRVLRRDDVASAQDVTSAYALAAQQKRLESIAFLRELLATGNAQGDRKAEMMLRLADLYYEEGRFIYFQEMERYATAQEACFATEGCELDSVQPDNASSREWAQNSIRLYEQILENYPRYARADEAMYYLASALQDIGNRDEGVQQFTRLVQVHPESGFVCDAYVNIGEYYFDNNNAYKALLAYKKATAYRDCDKYGFALYKLAWSYFNVGEYGEAITSMKEVVSYSVAQRSANGGTPLQLEEEALKDLIRFFADAGEVDEALRYFEGLGRRDLFAKMLKYLAAQYFENGKWEEAVQIYRRLIAEDVNASDNPDHQNEIIQAYHRLGNSDAELAEIDRMLRTYGRDTTWARNNADDPQSVQNALDKIERNFLRIASHYHDKGRRLNGSAQAAAFAIAEQGYAQFLTNFPASSNAYMAHYQFAELLYKLQKFDQAWDQYMAVVDSNPQGEHSEFCAESAVFAAEEMVKREGGLQATTATVQGLQPPQPLTAWEQRLVDSCKKYAGLYPGQVKVQQVIYKSAYLLYNKYHIEEAAAQFRGAIALNPGSRQAEQAANLILDSFVLQENWTALKENSKAFYQQEGLGSQTFKREVYDIYQRASLKVIDVAFEQSQDKGAAADAYVAFSEEFPDSPENPRILNNATIYYRDANRPADVMRIRHLLIDDARFGDKTKYYYDQIGALGFDYENTAQFDKAAFYYEKMFGLYTTTRAKIVRETPNDAERLAAMDQATADALYSAALFRRARGQFREAITDYQSFITTFPQDARVLDARLAIGRIYDEQNDRTNASTTYYAFYTQAPEGTPLEYLYFARLQYGQALEATNQQRKAKELYEETVAQYKAYIQGGGQPGAHTEFVAEMMYKLAQPKLDAYLARRITGCGCTNQTRENTALTASLKAKGDDLVALERAYAEIIQTGSGEFGLASLVALGRIYENMGETLATSDVPYYLTEDQREIYMLQLEDKVFPQKQKAIEAYNLALEKAFELTLYNDDTALATRRLGELDPETHPGLFETLPEVRATTSTLRNFDFEREL